MGIRLYFLGAALLAFVAIAATPPLFASGVHFTARGVLPCAQAYVVREHFGWILQLAQLSIAFLIGSIFTGVALMDPRATIRRLKDVWGR